MNRSLVTQVVAPLVAGVATVSTLATIGPVFADQGWLLRSVVVAIAIVASGIALRALGVRGAFVCVAQLLVGMYTLALIAVGPSMIGGFVPSVAALEAFLDLLAEGSHTARTTVAPIPPTAGTATLLALLVIPIAVLVDDFTATGKPALTGIPLLTLFAICAAIVRHPISMWLVAIPIVAYLLLLWLGDLGNQQGRRVTVGLGSLLGTGAILAVAIAVAATITVAVRLPDGGLFAVAGTADRSPNETVARSTDLAGQLSRSEPLPLFTVTTDDPAPFYLRALVLSNWGENGWSFSNPQDDGVDPAQIPPGELSNATATTRATITVEKYSDIFVPTYYFATGVTIEDAKYDEDMAVVFTEDKGMVAGKTYEVNSSVPRPTEAELQAAGSVSPGQLGRYQVIPADVDESVVALTESITGSASTSWEAAVALDTFFNDPAQGFTYSLEVPSPEGADPLASFLDKRIGFCEQYASAMAGMLRIAGVPARVVVGYTNGQPDEDGVYEITTDDAHAWVEAYFSGVGWVPFDPTPIGDRAVPLPYAPGDQSDLGSEQPGFDLPPEQAPGLEEPVPEEQPAESLDGQSPSAQDERSGAAVTVEVLRWVALVLLVLVLLAGPGLVRRARWRTRLNAATSGGRDGALAAWSEIEELTSALGTPATASLSPRAQARHWQEELEISGSDLEVIAAAAQHARYSADAAAPPVDAELERARAQIRRQVGPVRWWVAALVPRWLRRSRRH